MAEKNTTIDEYIVTHPKAVREFLEKIRETIKTVAPEAEETISYGIPTFKFKGKNLAHFAGFKNHIGFYATPSGNEAFKIELSKYKQGKGSVQFPFNKSMPYNLIKRMVEFRIIEISRNKN